MAVMLAAIWALDHFTAPLIDVSVMYFLPIAYAAWSLGRLAALVTAFVAAAPAYFDQALLVRTHLELPVVAAINMVSIVAAIESITVPESRDDLTVVCIKRTDVLPV